MREAYMKLFTDKRLKKRSLRITGTSLAFLLMLAGCVHNPPKLYGRPGTAPSSDKTWQPPARIARDYSSVEQTKGEIPKELLKRSASLTLMDIVDIALRNSPQTSAAWARARSAAAALGSQRGTYYPSAQGTVEVSRAEGTFANGNIDYFQRSYQPRVTMNWLLFDFGGREAAIREKMQALVAADFSHNAVIQDVILGVEQAYYRYLASKSLHKARSTAVKEAEANLMAAGDRHNAGLATIADVLQAKTALAQAQLQAESSEGTVQITRGALATAMGLPADVPYDVEGVPAEPDIDKTLGKVNEYLDKAVVQRPDLSAAKAEVLKSSAHLKKVKAEIYPSLQGTADLGRTYYDSRDIFGNNYNMGLTLKVPIFNGFSHRYNVFQARADQNEAAQNYKSLEQKVTYQVWSSYYSLKTAKKRVSSARDLLESATKSHEVALARYKAGVGGILDLLAAQSALQDARAQKVQADADWYTALAQLAHDSGTLDAHDNEASLDKPINVKKEGKP